MHPYEMRLTDAKETVDEFVGILLDANSLARRKLLGPDTSGTVILSIPHRGPPPRMRVLAGPDVRAIEGGRCRWLTVQWGNEQQAVVRLLPSQIHFGQRWFFECTDCGRRAAKLYWQNAQFRCWRCADLTHRSARYACLGKRLRAKLRQCYITLEGVDPLEGR